MHKLVTLCKEKNKTNSGTQLIFSLTHQKNLAVFNRVVILNERQRFCLGQNKVVLTTRWVYTYVSGMAARWGSTAVQS